MQYLPQEGILPIVVTAGVSASDGNRWTPTDASLSALVPPEVLVHRVAQPVVANVSSLQRRIERWFGRQSTFGKWWIPAAVELGSTVGQEAELIFATMSPFESGEAARQLSERLRLPWVADLRDPWALDDSILYPSKLHRRLDMVRMEEVLSSASLIIMNTNAACRAVQKAFPSLRNKSVIAITNGFDRTDFACDVSLRQDAKFRIVHSGTMLTDTGLQLRRRSLYRLLGGAEKGVDIITRSPKFLLEAVDFWSKRCSDVKNNVELIFVGNTTEEDRAAVTSSPVSDLIRLPGFLSHRESLAMIRTADLLFLPMHNLPPGADCKSVPGKTYEYMASGRPILAAVPDGDARQFLTECGTGLVCRPDDVEGMVDILNRVYTKWKSGEEIVHPDARYIEQFERRTLTRVLARELHKIVSDKKSINPEEITQMHGTSPEVVGIQESV